MLKAIYPGTFDPITNGHLDIIKRASKIFVELIVAVTTNPAKNPCFPLLTRIRLIKDSTKNLANITVIGFNTLLVEFLRAQKATIILRGLRAVSDFEFELQLASMNRKLAPEFETLFLTPAEHLTCISSSLVMEIARLNGDVSDFVPQPVLAALKNI